MQRLGSLFKRIVDSGGNLIGWFVPIMVLLVLFEVFMRYVMGRPPIVADEFSAYLLVALSFLGVAYTWQEKGHVRVTALVEKLPVRFASWLRVLTLVIGLIFSVAMVQSSYNLLVISLRLNMVSSTWVRTPLWVPQMTLIIGFVFLAFLLIVEIIRAIGRLRAGKSVEE